MEHWVRRTWELSNIFVNIRSDDKIHRVSQMAKSHPPGQFRWFLSSKFPHGKVGEGVLSVELPDWLPQRKREAETRERSISLGGRASSRISFSRTKQLNRIQQKD